MKNITISIITIFIFFDNIYAQDIFRSIGNYNVHNMTVIDSGNIRIWYAFNATDISKQETYGDLQRLEIGSHISKYYSYFLFNNDSLITVWIKEHPTAQSIPNQLASMGKKAGYLWDEYIFSEYIIDYTKNSLTQYMRKPLGNTQNLQYSEDMPKQKWEIADDTLTIAGYLCQKATCSFRGRNFTAWFAMDIPIQNGPWKFGGLPGLILKVYDDDKLYEFECVKIENFKKKYPVKIYNHYKNFEKTDRQKLLKFVKRLYDDYPNVAGLNPSGFKNGWKKTPYNPLELE